MYKYKLKRRSFIKSSTLAATGLIIGFTFDPKKSLFMNLSYEKVISEANIINYDYIADSFSLSFSKSFHLNK